MNSNIVVRFFDNEYIAVWETSNIPRIGEQVILNTGRYLIVSIVWVKPSYADVVVKKDE